MGLDTLLEVSGIGSETLNDIKRAYNSLSELKEALENDKAPFRNDIVELLKKHLKVKNNGD